MTKGLVISGEFGKIIVRQKSAENMELGELLVADTSEGKIILQVFDLLYGSQISQTNLELISGLHLEENDSVDFMDPGLRNYTLALLKPIVAVSKDSARLCKMLPSFFSEVRGITKDDLKFLTTPDNPLVIGKLRSGSKIMDVDIMLDGRDVFTHHILIAATTGKGKSNLLSCMLWNNVAENYSGALVLDPHDEYFGRNKLGLKDHPMKGKVVYYTPKNPPPGAKTLKLNIRNIKPAHFDGTISWSDAQSEALAGFYRRYGKQWVEAVISDKPLANFQEGTINVVKRRVMSLLDIEFLENKFYFNGVFDLIAGESTIKDIASELEQSMTVIIDTSSFSGSVEILVGSLLATEVFNRYKRYKLTGELGSKPVISVVLEEAPRVLGKEAMEQGPNIFSTIAREGRKFQVGLTAITQLPSLIPRQVLANMNTKIILGIEMAPERAAIIDSAAQDLSTENRNIASLDKGEAIVSSNFSRFAIPVKIPLFKDVVHQAKKQKTVNSFEGVGV